MPMHIYIYTHTYIHTYMHERMCMHAYRQADERTDGQTDRQTNRPKLELDHEATKPTVILIEKPPNLRYHNQDFDYEAT